MKKLTKILVATAIAGAAFSAQATTKTTTATASVSNAKSSTGKTLDLTKFNVALGTLTSVKVELSSNYGSLMKVENTSKSSAANIVFKSTGALTLVSGGKTLAVLAPVLTTTLHEAIYDKSTDFGGTSGTSLTMAPVSFSNSAIYTDAATLALFSGTGNLSTTLFGSSTASFTSDAGNVASFASASFDGMAKVTYTYALAPVPEADTYAMMVAGLALLGVVARKRKSA